MVMHNGNYLFSGNIARTTESCEYLLFGYHVTKISEDGTHDTTIIFDKCNQTSYIGWKNSFLAKDDLFFINGLIYNETNKSTFYLLSLNEVFDTIANYILYEDTITKRNLSMYLSHNEEIIICGQIDSTYNEITGLPETTYTKSLLLSADTNGNILWSKSYSFGNISDGCWSAFYRVVPAYDNGYIAMGITHDFSNRKALVVKTDSVGNLQWYRIYGNGAFDNPGFSDIIPTHDSCFIVCGAYTYGETFGGLYPYDGWLIKIDNDGNTKWEKKYREHRIEPGDYRDSIYCQFNSVCELSNNNIAIAGTARKETGYSNRTPFLYLLNEYGDTLLTKYYYQYQEGHPDYVNVSYPTSIFATDDGGLAIGGWAEFIEYDEINHQWTNPQRIFLIKTDSLGNDTIISNISPIESKPITEFKLQCYPNPVSSEFFIELPLGLDDDVLEVYSTTGSLVWQQNVGVGTNRVGTLELKPGMYLMKIKGANLYGKFVKE